jgi:hypothetical protein
VASAQRSLDLAQSPRRKKPARRGTPRRSRPRDAVRRQRSLSLAQMIADLPTGCDRGAKCNAQGYKICWNGYKAHIDTAECGVPVSVLVSSASMHDSRAAIPLSMISAQRVTSLYDVMDSAYCSLEIHEHCRSLGHVPLIDHNRRGGEKEPFEPADARRYGVRSGAERTNARLKDEFGGRHVRVRGHKKVTSHIMFGVLALTGMALPSMRLAGTSSLTAATTHGACRPNAPVNSASTPMLNSMLLKVAPGAWGQTQRQPARHARWARRQVSIMTVGLSR